MSNIFPKDKVIEVKNTTDAITRLEYLSTQDEWEKVIIFSKTLTNNGDTLILSELFNDDMSIALKHNDKILDFCIANSLPIQGVYEALVTLDIAYTKLLYKAFVSPKINKLKLPDGLMEPDEDEIRKELYTQFDRVCDYGNNLPNLGKKINPIAFQEILNNSYDEIKKRILISTKNTNLPLSQYSISSDKIIDDINTEKSRFDKIFTNPKSLSKIEQDNHFFSYLLRDNLEITDDYKVIFGGHTKALGVGYTSKAILLSLDKNIAIRELNTNLKHLEKYNTSESRELIIYTKHLIEFIKQKRNANIIPFKALAKELGITKNQAKNYAKKLLSINDKTFTNNFEDIKLLNK